MLCAFVERMDFEYFELEGEYGREWNLSDEVYAMKIEVENLS